MGGGGGQINAHYYFQITQILQILQLRNHIVMIVVFM